MAKLNRDEYAKLARLTAAEGAVLLRNEAETLPLRQDETVALFGRTQLNYYKSGTGSGGMVNTEYTVGIIEGLQNSGVVKLDGELLRVYADWVAAVSPFVKGEGWGKEPWAQEEMTVTPELAAGAAARSDAAVVVIGRTAGEDRDNSAEKGSYYLTDTEEEMLAAVCGAFKRVAVILNVGNIIDMSWVEKYKPGAVMYVWHGGQEGGNAAADVLTGKVNPCGRLADTIARELTDYPCHLTPTKASPSPGTPNDNFGGDTEAVYAEDIYVGYRYFETVAKDKVLYPFGFGLSYTTFKVELSGAEREKAQFEPPYLENGRRDYSEWKVSYFATVKNTGTRAGKHVVQLYLEAPQGKLGKPSRVLVACAKTKLLEPDERQTLEIPVMYQNFMSYDDSGATGNKSCWVLESGIYTVFAGDNVRDAKRMPSGGFGFLIGPYFVIPIEQHISALAPVKPFKRMKFDGEKMKLEKVPLREYDIAARIAENALPERKCTGDRGIKLIDVKNGKASLDDFIDQIPDDVLACLMRGEGMASPKGAAGAAGVFGGLTEELRAFGIPIACCTDGPSGLRFDPTEATASQADSADGAVAASAAADAANPIKGMTAFSLPNGTCIACTWNAELAEELFSMTGREMRENNVDLILGPGVNLHRSPLGGRNFEYFSEDPYLTGSMAAAQLRGMHRHGVSGTIKHFVANDQEHRRFGLDSVVSERALREIYLKGFEIAVREGGLMSVMTTYGKVNGTFTAGSYDLNTVILRGDWGFDGIAMTDWWAFAADAPWPPDPNSVVDRAAMVRAQNDLFMVCADTKAENAKDNIVQSLADGTLSRADLHRSAANILSVIMRLPAMERV